MTLNIVLIAIAIAITVFLKNENTFRQHCLILDAIHDYQIAQIRSAAENGHFIHFMVDYDDMESYGKTMLRLWDWGYAKILPPAKFELIKPYIKTDTL